MAYFQKNQLAQLEDLYQKDGAYKLGCCVHNTKPTLQQCFTNIAGNILVADKTFSKAAW